MGLVGLEPTRLIKTADFKSAAAAISPQPPVAQYTVAEGKAGRPGFEWRRRDSNLRPRAYESPALPLSYIAKLSLPGLF